MNYGGNLSERSFDEQDAHALRTGISGLGLDVEASPRTRPCPKCGARAALHAADCKRCGVNFAKHRLALEMAVQARPVYGVLTAKEKREGVREITAPPKTSSAMPLVVLACALFAGFAFAIWG